jgi:hypothetical protein
MSYNLEKYDEWLCRPIAPGDLGQGASGVIDHGIHLYFFAARKTSDFVSRPIPHQPLYSGKILVKKAPWFMPYVIRSGAKEALQKLGRFNLSGFSANEGYLHMVPLPTLPHLCDESNKPWQSPLILLEDGKPLGPPHSMHQTIRELGRGAFSHWQGVLYFSTSDNTDPKTNGRTYVAVVPDWTGIV